MSASAGRRRAGLLIPLFSCASSASWGIGDIGDVAPMTEWLASAGQRVLQLLPLNEMAPGQQSPYSAISAMAIDPIFIPVAAVPEFAAPRRIWSPDVKSNRFWFQVDGGNWITWRITVGKIWYWNYFHVDTLYNDVLHFPLAAGAHTLLIANEVPGARLDRLYITGAGDRPPGNDTPCNPPHSIDFDGAGDCHPSCGAQAPVGMHTTCVAATCDGKEMKTAYDCNVCCVVP